MFDRRTTGKIAGKRKRMASILRSETVKSVRDEMIFRVIQPNGVSAKTHSLSGFEVMQIAVSREYRNDNGRNSTKNSFVGQQ